MRTIDVTPGREPGRPGGYDKVTLAHRVAEELVGTRPVSYQTVCRWLKKLKMDTKPPKGYDEDHVTLLKTIGQYLTFHDKFALAYAAAKAEIQEQRQKPVSTKSEKEGDLYDQHS